MRESHALPIRRLTAWLAVGLALSAATLAGLGYSAIREWRRNAVVLATERASERVDLAVTALTRDMRGVQGQVAAWRWEEPGDVLDLVAGTFARYPYPEWFFMWRGGMPAEALDLFARSNRLPSWFTPDRNSSRFPVAIGSAPGTAALLLSRIVPDAATGRRFSIFNVAVGGTQHQIITRLLHADAYHEELAVAFGFAVDLDWTRNHYFTALLSEVARIDGADGSGLAMSVLDEDGRAVAGADVAAGGPSSRRDFPLMFFDPLLVALSPPDDLARRVWSVEVWAGGDPTLHAVSRGALRTLMVGAVAAGVLAFGLVLVSRSLRARAEFVEMRSDLVSSVTHELKTPLASIRAAAGTLASGRVGNGREVREYAQILLGEAGRLTRLVDNLLAYARITDVTDVYSFEPVVLGDLIDEALQGFAVPLDERRFELAVHIPLELPPVVADRTALRLLLDNLIDNAIRYSTVTASLSVSARQQNGSVVLEVADRGRGIPPEEIRHVTKKFFRGRRATPGGSGLGLAIAQRIVSDHQGTLSILSTVGAGTTVRVTLPASRDEAIHEEAHSRR